MIVVDLGNTNIVIGFFNNNKLISSIRFETIKFKYEYKFKSILLKKVNKFRFLNKRPFVILGSVVPNKDKEIKKFSKNINFSFLDIKNKNTILNLKFYYKSIKELGADRIANSIAGIDNYGKNLIILDFGTATTFDIVKNGQYLGGIISPGINVSNSALAKSAAKLKIIDIKKPSNLIGRNTKQAMQSGFFWGYTSLINGIISKIIFLNNFSPKIILTGGMAKIFKKEIRKKVIIDQNLTLIGLYHIGNFNVVRSEKK